MPLTSTRNQDLKKNLQQRQHDRIVEVRVEAELVDAVVAGHAGCRRKSATALTFCASSLLGCSASDLAAPQPRRC